ncbi:SusC/RagA family TonB-linked outer membrane protein [Hymenobacter daeguensis]
MKRNIYLIALVRRSAVLLACGLPAVAAAAPATAAIRLVRPAADVPVSGRVTGPDGSGLPGVTVLVRGTTLGTSTNADGAFNLTAPEGSTLVFSFVGYTTQTATVSASGPISISLKEDTQKLNEIVVVGYGTQQRGSVTGAVSSVSSREIASQPVADATQAIQGRAAGVTVTSNGGAPGGAAGTSIRVRGITSAGNNNPLYVVDGFPLPDNGSENQLNAISPNDIESIDILKDASATAIYGLRAANGVVIITTKRGKAGVSTVNVDAYRGVQQVWRKLSLLNAEEYAVINNENRIANGDAIVVDKLRDPKSLGEGTNWQDEVFRRAAIQNYSLSATGGSDKAKYAVSGTYFQQDGTIIGSHFERFTLRANGDIQLNKIFKIGNSISLTHLQDRQITSNSGEYGTVQQMLRIPAFLPVYRPDGYYYEPRTSDNFIEENPLASATITNQKFVRNRMLTTFYAELEPLKGLRFRTNVGADLIFDNYNAFRPGVPELRVGTEVYNTRYTQLTAGSSATSGYTPSYLIENTITYDHLFGDKHQVTLLAGQSAQEFNYSNVEAYRTGYLRNDLQTTNSGPINTSLANAGTINPPSHLASYFARLNYEFGGKYLFSAIARYDGSGNFPPGEQFGFFPGVSAGWRVSEEEFLKGNRVISNLKIRAGYGKVGNPNNAGRFAYLYAVNSGILVPFGTTATGGGVLQTGAAPTRQANSELRWETNNQANFGIDLGFMDNRFEATIDLYNRTSPNLIAPVPPSLVSGTYESVNRNAASAYNRGIDLSLTSHNVQTADFNWTTNLNVSAYKTRLESLGIGRPYNGLTALSGVIVRYDQGQPFGSFYGFVADGLFQTPEDVKNHAFQQNGTAPGDIRFKDLNNDGVINADDRTFIGNPNPSFTYGFNNTVTWKGFDLNVFVQGSQGNKIYNQNRYLLESALYGNSSGSTRVLARWTGPGTSNDVPRAIAGDPNQNLRVSTYYMEDGSYLRIKTLTLGYTLPKAIMDRIYTKQLRVYVSAQNLLTLTKYSGFDPEVGSRGVDLGIYPQPRVFLAGLNIGF